MQVSDEKLQESILVLMKPFNKKIPLTEILIVSVLIAFILVTMFEEGPNISERIADRIFGPLHLRLIFQPLIAIIIGFRDGKVDEAKGNPPFLFSLFQRSHGSKNRWSDHFKSVLIPLLVGILLDIVVQRSLFLRIRIVGAIIAGVVLIGLPYSFSRGLTNRIKRSSKTF